MSGDNVRQTQYFEPMKEIGTLRAAIYVRVSQDRKGRGKSVGEQEKESIEACEQQGFEVSKMFQDNDKSASRHSKKSRPGYLAMREYLATGNVDVLVLWESSRGSRELEEWAGLLNLCRRMKILIHVVTHHRTYDMENPRDRRTLAEDGVDSEYESDKTRERILRSVRSNQSAGRPHGKLLYGYSRMFDHRGDAQWVINEEQAAIVREVAERVAASESLYAIAVDLNERQVPTPRAAALPRLIEKEKDSEKRAKFEAELATANYQWDPTQIRRLCGNPAYMGKRAVGGQDKQWRIVGDATWDAIIEDQTWQACANIINDEGRRRKSDGSVKHLLTGIAVTSCGAPMRRMKNRGVYSYICEADFCTGIQQQRLEDYVVEQLRERLIFMSRLEIDDNSDQEVARQRSEARREAKELRDYLENFTKEAATLRLSAARVAAMERELMPKIEELEAKSRAERIPRIVLALTHDPDKWDDMTIPQRREALRRMVKVTVLKIGRGRRSYDIADRVVLEWTEDQLQADYQAQYQKLALSEVH